MTYLTDSTPLLVLDDASTHDDVKDTRYGTARNATPSLTPTLSDASSFSNKSTKNHGDKKAHDYATTHLEISPYPSMKEPSEQHFSSDSLQLGTIPLTVIIFYTVSGGPFGVEEAIRSAGAFYSILGFAIMPFVFSLPESLMTACTCTVSIRNDSSFAS